MSDPSDAALLDRARGALLGLAAGDAVGTAVEFRPRGSFEPLTDMVGGGPFRLKPGQWTDDTSMALCLAESLLEKRGFDAADQMRGYLAWCRDGFYSSTGTCFDVGMTVRRALDDFEATGEPFSGSTSPNTAGNGSIMRLAPVVLFFHPDAVAVDRWAAESSRTTHGAPEAVAACRILAGIIGALLGGASRDEALAAVAPAEWMSPGLRAIAAGDYRDKSADEVEGSGYVVRSLEAALWSFAGAGSFEEAILRAANLGDDADTTAAVCGQVAGAWWGASAIPPHWLERLHMAEEIGRMAEDLIRA